MKHCCLLFAIILCLSWASPACAESTLRIMATEWPPVSSSDPANPGVVIEFINAAFALSGINVEYDFDPWPRNFVEIKSGHYFAATPYTKTPERQKHFKFSEPYLKATITVFFNKKALPDYDYEEMDSLRQYRVGVLKGWFSTEEWAKHGIKYEVVGCPTQAFKMLARGRLDLFVFDRWSGTNYMKQLDISEAEVGIASSPYRTVLVHLMASKTYPGADRYLAIFNANAAKLKDSDTLDHIARKYQIAKDAFDVSE